MIIFTYDKAIALSLSDSVRYHFGSLCQRICNLGNYDASALPFCLPLQKINVC